MPTCLHVLYCPLLKLKIFENIYNAYRAPLLLTSLSNIGNMSGISDSEAIQTLTNTLTCLNGLPFVSLRIWYEDGQMKFFFSNLPPRNARKPVHQSTETVKMKKKDPSLEKPGPSPAKTRGRGRKRQCISTPENRFASPRSAAEGELHVHRFTASVWTGSTWRVGL